MTFGAKLWSHRRLTATDRRETCLLLLSEYQVRWVAEIIASSGRSGAASKFDIISSSTREGFAVLVYSPPPAHKARAHAPCRAPPIDQGPLELNKRLSKTIAHRASRTPRIRLTAGCVPHASVEGPLHQFGRHQERGHYGQQICKIGGRRMHEFEPLADHRKVRQREGQRRGAECKNRHGAVRPAREYVSSCAHGENHQDLRHQRFNEPARTEKSLRGVKKSQTQGQG